MFFSAFAAFQRLFFSWLENFGVLRHWLCPQELIMSPSLTSGQLRAVLSWSAESELDLHLKCLTPTKNDGIGSEPGSTDGSVVIALQLNLKRCKGLGWDRSLHCVVISALYRLQNSYSRRSTISWPARRSRDPSHPMLAQRFLAWFLCC